MRVSRQIDWPVFEVVCDYSLPTELGRLAQLSRAHNKYVTERKDYQYSKATVAKPKTWLSYACQLGKIWLAEWSVKVKCKCSILGKKVRCYRRCNDYVVGMSVACYQGRIRMAEWCMKKGGKGLRSLLIDEQEKYGMRYDRSTWLRGRRGIKGGFNGMLAWACRGGQKHAAEWCLQHGANDFNFALPFACRWNQLDMAQWCVDHGANNFNWALQLACEGGHIETAKWCLDHGANRLMCDSVTFVHHSAMYEWMKNNKPYMLNVGNGPY
jgi:hypothetical protein